MLFPLQNSDRALGLRDQNAPPIELWPGRRDVSPRQTPFRNKKGRVLHYTVTGVSDPSKLELEHLGIQTGPFAAC